MLAVYLSVSKTRLKGLLSVVRTTNYKVVTLFKQWNVMPLLGHFGAEVVETTLVVSRFRFLRVESRISKLRVIILPGMQILKVGSLISDCSWFCFSYLKFFVASSCFNRLGATRNEKIVNYNSLLY